jgi:two-component system chemotaxis response regulator CheY
MAVDLSMSVLVVDDYNTMISIIRNLLKQLGFDNIDDASDGSEALNKMRGKKYGLVISDWNMEPMTGYDLLKEVRADPNLATTPFIMITAESKTENVIAAKKAGVNNYIVKPFNAATLKTKIEAVFPDMVRIGVLLSRTAASGRLRPLPARAGRGSQEARAPYHRSSLVSARGGWPNSSFTEAGSS